MSGETDRATENMYESGTIVEYIDDQKIRCAVILEQENERVRLFSENNRELNQKVSRLSHASAMRLPIHNGRDKLLESLKQVADRRQSLSQKVDIRELWEVLSPMEEWVDLPTMAGLCFPENPTGDHEAAVIRAWFANRIYFKFSKDGFLPYTPEEVEKNIAREKEKERRDALIASGAQWLKAALEGALVLPTEEAGAFVEMMKSYYLFGKESVHHPTAHAILEASGADSVERIFDAMVNLGIWGPDQNLDLERCGIPVTFSETALKKARGLERALDFRSWTSGRKDLTDLPLMTIDGQGTLDFDDAISMQAENGCYQVGVHIADVAACIQKEDDMDFGIAERGTSIYMPDMKIPMLPSIISEGLCSLKAGEVRPAISIFFKVSRDAEVFESRIVPSIIRVKQQLTYNHVDTLADSDETIQALCELAAHFRKRRLEAGGILISLPEVTIRVFETGEISVKRFDKEAPSRLLVSEMMIMANWLMARFLSEHAMPAVFRSQPEPKARLYGPREEGGLFQTWMQRRQLSRVVIDALPNSHSGLGLNVYVTATSPIRKYFDLVTQRQIRGCLGLETPYTRAEIEHIIQVMEEPLSRAMTVQYRRHRYWLLRYLEKMTGTKTEAVVLEQRRDRHVILLTEYLIECRLPASGNWNLQPGDMLRVIIDRVDARRDLLAVTLG